MTTTAIRTVDTPHGPLTLVASDHGLTRATFRTVRCAAPGGHPAAHAWLDLAHRELDAYFAGELRQFTVPVDLSRVEDAHRRILDALAELPYGRTTTYGALATRLGLVEDGPRQVGAAMARNPVLIVVALPPRPRGGRHPHRLRGRPRRQAGPARPRTPRPARPTPDGHRSASGWGEDWPLRGVEQLERPDRPPVEVDGAARAPARAAPRSDVPVGRRVDQPIVSRARWAGWSARKRRRRARLEPARIDQKHIGAPGERLTDALPHVRVAEN